MKPMRNTLSCLIIFIFAAAAAACAADEQQASRLGTILDEQQASQLGTTLNYVKTNIKLTTGETEIYGVGVLLDSGEEIEAYLPLGMINVFVEGMRVRVEPGQFGDLIWTVAEVLPEGAPTPNATMTAEAYVKRCQLTGGVLRYEAPNAEGWDELTQALRERMDCEVELVSLDPEALVPFLASGDGDFAVDYLGSYFQNRDFVETSPLLVGLIENEGQAVPALVLFTYAPLEEERQDLIKRTFLELSADEQDAQLLAPMLKAVSFVEVDQSLWEAESFEAFRDSLQ